MLRINSKVVPSHQIATNYTTENRKVFLLMNSVIQGSCTLRDISYVNRTFQRNIFLGILKLNDTIVWLAYSFENVLTSVRVTEMNKTVCRTMPPGVSEKSVESHKNWPWRASGKETYKNFNHTGFGRLVTQDVYNCRDWDSKKKKRNKMPQFSKIWKHKDIGKLVTEYIRNHLKIYKSASQFPRKITTQNG